jgi:hypothetical protein
MALLQRSTHTAEIAPFDLSTSIAIFSCAIRRLVLRRDDALTIRSFGSDGSPGGGGSGLNVALGGGHCGSPTGSYDR